MSLVPSKGRIVLYRAGTELVWPAIVTIVHNPDTVDLVVFSDEPVHIATHVGYSTDPYKADTWHWPPRV